MAKKKKRRTRSPHPGVVLVRRKRKDGPDRWRAKWTDPDTAREQWKTLDGPELELTSNEARLAWAKAKSRTLARRKAQIEAGADKVIGTGFHHAIETYIEAKRCEVRSGTAYLMRDALGRLQQWAETKGLQQTSDLTPAALAGFRDHVVAMKKQTAAAKAGRGAKKSTGRDLSAESKNRILSYVATCVRDWRRRKLVHLSSDDIADALRRVKTSRPVPTFLRSGGLRRLLEAALRHDRQTFALTRAEHDGRRPAGSTPRYEPAAPFVLTVLLTGCRRGEVDGLRWNEVHAEEEAIVVDASRVKTGHGRRVDLAVCPSLTALLRALRLRSGGGEYVFPAWRGGNLASSTRKRLTEYGAPEDWTYQMLRRTCGTFLTCAPSIYGAASAFLSAKRLGHGVQVAERNYAGVLTGIDRAARTLEAAMRIEDFAEEIVARVRGEEARQTREA